MMDKIYVDTVRLLLEAAPHIFRSNLFALKGGTALNLFVRDMPRLSVDIDVVYTPHQSGREDALKEISSQLVACMTHLEAGGLQAEVLRTRVGDEVKMLVRRDRIQVKVEVNHVFRGTVLPIEKRGLVQSARDLFTSALTLPVLAEPELYGSKLVAALDRQHPRDFFDVSGLFQTTGLTREVVECFVCYLAGHNRPIHEVLFSRDLELSTPFENEFQGMTREEVSLGDLLETRDRLRAELPLALTQDHKEFLIGLVAADPDWDLIASPHLADLPALRWKVENIRRLERTNPEKFRFQSEELRRRFSV